MPRPTGAPSVFENTGECSNGLCKIAISIAYLLSNGLWRTAHSRMLTPVLVNQSFSSVVSDAGYGGFTGDFARYLHMCPSLPLRVEPNRCPIMGEDQYASGPQGC